MSVDVLAWGLLAFTLPRRRVEPITVVPFVALKLVGFVLFTQFLSTCGKLLKSEALIHRTAIVFRVFAAITRITDTEVLLSAGLVSTLLLILLILAMVAFCLPCLPWWYWGGGCGAAMIFGLFNIVQEYLRDSAIPVAVTASVCFLAFAVYYIYVLHTARAALLTAVKASETVV